MTPNDQFVDTLKKLLERTARNEVNWRRSAQNAFEVTFQHSPRTSISLAYGSPEAAPDWYDVVLRVGDEIAINLNAEDETDTDLFNLLHELWTQAERSVVKWDLSLEMVNKVLDSEKKVGVELLADRDVPF